ncbi:uncharacterized protein CXQ87_001558 [Candidozyma duobushaemuli]|uniref:Aminopeptidase n=2 Tax=Candidozyma TaxID=3303203 RepID=A0ABX8I6L7_9ASCO|nr:uncharacterized protein CXQ87_001558 [[Candida] duobushaemulonis]PVH13454.1 hypothetical protein CXQ87_001558 [[Candida] duobushaemulonis]QWU88300.1 hypothetical protein CA3LBN_002565 [[Candida] haemuloni]
MALRLDNAVQCVEYDLTFTVDPDSEDYKCEGVIDLAVFENRDAFALNASRMDLTSIQFNGNAVTYSIDEDAQLLNINHAVKAGEKAQLTFACTGKCSNDMYGVYRSSYEDFDDNEESSEDSDDAENDESAAKTDIASDLESLAIEKVTSNNANEKFLISTQFEPIGARRAFPCIDDPARKSHFTISLVHPTKFTALSNCPISESVKIDECWSRTRYEKSPLMSTYLVAFVVGELESLKSETLPIKAWTVVGGAEEASFALEVAEKSFPFFENIFGYQYPLAKLDLVAIPDFANSAMENFGLITFKEADFLVGSNPSQSLKETVFEAVSHEISHQWFGNLVTMDFWDGLWLNEGFATWCSWYVMNHFHPEWKVWGNYIVYTLSTAFIVDGRTSSHPINMPIENFHDIEQAGDEITYQKGCSLVVMLFDFLGEDAFFAGLKKYIQKYAWANTKASDLWECLSSASGLDVSSIMNSWITRPGFPIVQVEELEGNKLRLEQRRFLPTGDGGSEDPYVIPLKIQTSQKVVKTLFKDSSMELSIPDGPYFINPNHQGYYVTSYSDERWAKLAKGKLSGADRIGTLSDCSLASLDGGTSVVAFLQLAGEFSKLQDSTLMNAIVEIYFDLLDVYLFDEAIFASLCRFGGSIIKSYTPISFVKSDEDSSNQALFKNAVFRFAAFVKAPEIDHYCDEQFDKFINHGQELDPDKAAIIIRNIVRRNDAKTWDKLWGFYRKETDRYTKEDILRSLGNTSNPKILSKFLGFVLHSDEIDSQDIISSISPINNTAMGVTLLWSWLKENWDAISVKLEYGSVVHLGVVKTCLKGLCTREHSKQVEEFFQGKRDVVLEKAIANIQEKIKGRYLQAEKNRQTLTTWLATKDY